MPNVFILCAGRTASTTFTHACSHITNFTCMHESNVQKNTHERTLYPENHIEIDNRLAWFTAHLESNYGKEGYYVYLTRDKNQIAKSYLERWHLKESIVKAYGHGVLMKPYIAKKDRLNICLDYVDHIETNIQSFLADKPNTMTIDTTELKDKFSEFYTWIDAKGDITNCLKEFDVYSNKNKTNALQRIKNKITNLL